MRIFIDSDVVISSLLSTSGASHALLSHSQIAPVISTLSQKELEIVIKRLGIAKEKLDMLIKERVKKVDLGESPDQIKRKYQEYVIDQNDAHIIAGVVGAKANFLITYNLKHYKIDKIRTDFDIMVMKPATFLQYLRSR